MNNIPENNINSIFTHSRHGIPQKRQSLPVIQYDHLINVETVSYNFPVLMNTNITGALCNKLVEIKEIANQHQSDIVCITESWCSDTIPDDTIHLPGFTSFRRDRQDGRAGGGLMCYVRDCLPVVKCWSQLNDVDLETLWITLRPRRLPRGISHVTVCVVYHPPRADDWVMCQHLINGIDNVKQTFPMSGLIIVGDFNHMKDSYFKKACQLHQIVTKPTHGNSVIDLCYTSLKDFYCSPIHEPGIGLSRHQTLIFRPTTNSPSTNEVIYISKRNQSPINKLCLKQAILDVNWSPLYRATSCQEKFDIFQDTMNALIEKCLPVHTVKRNTNDLPWVTDKFRFLIKKRQFYFHSGNETLFRFYRNKVNRERKKLKSDHVMKTMCNLKQNNPRDWWKNIKSLVGINKKGDCLESMAQSECDGDVSKLANNINDFFKNVSSHLTPLSDDIIAVNHHIPDEFIIPIHQVEQRLQKIKTTKSSGPDNIPNWLLQDLSKELSAPICAIWNASFRDSYIPAIWKSANTCPLPKVSPPLNIKKDLRPISLTPILSKGIEFFAREWFMNVFRPHIDKFQYGSQSECSTVIALAQLIHGWLQQLENNKAVRILLIDFSKAFDLVDHNILINKISNIGTPPFLTAWLHSFLCERRQRVKIGDTFSSWASLNAGVPQGTLLGPSTFLLHINDLTTVCHSVKYVDDTTLWEACDKKGSDSKIQIAADQASTWCQTNNMKINADKTKEMIIDFSRKPFHFDPISMNDSDLECVNKTKLLGVIINDSLSWHDHVDYICGKAAKRLYFLRLLKRANIPSVDIVHVFCSIIRSLLEYACEIWNPGLTKQQSNKLELIQKRAFKIALPNIRYDEALLQCNIKTLHSRREDICKTFFDNICNPNHKLHNLLPQKINLSHLRSNRQYQLPKVKTNRMKNSPIFYGVFNFQ